MFKKGSQESRKYTQSGIFSCKHDGSETLVMKLDIVIPNTKQNASIRSIIHALAPRWVKLLISASQCFKKQESILQEFDVQN